MSSVPAMIADPAGLAALCERLAHAGSFSLDTEFLRERTYSAKLCLVQVATEDECVLVDPLALKDLDPLLRLVADPSVQVVLHAAEQDLEIFFGLSGLVPKAVFDTQVSAALVGEGDQIAYATLVKRVLGHVLTKTETATDWSRRPLSPEQWAYALDDVRYLPALRSAMDRRLRELGRSDWLAEELAHLEDPETYTVRPEESWKRVKRANSLKPRSLAILRELAAWRELEARRSDRPRGWIIKDEAMAEIARLAVQLGRPMQEADLEKLRHMDGRKIRSYGRTVIDLVGRGMDCPSDDRPEMQRAQREDSERSLLVDVLDAVLQAMAREHSIAPRVLGTRSDIRDLLEHLDGRGRRDLDGRPGPRLLDGWRRRLAGDVLVDVAEGRRRLCVQPGTDRLIISGNDGA